MKIKFLVLFSIIFLGVLCRCADKSIVEDEGIIKTIQNKEAAIKSFDTSYFIFFENGIEVDSPNLLDTIYLLMPVNLPVSFRKDSLEVTVSGDILENPGYSSHNNYTSFIISEIREN